MDRNINRILFCLIRYEMCGEQIGKDTVSELTPETLARLYALAKAHDAEHLVASALTKLGVLGTDELSQRIAKQQMIAIFRCERLCYELSELCRTLEEAGIPFMPLKGSVIRPLYPEAWMRTSCDIDVLVHKSDLEAACAALVEGLGYKREGMGSHDVSLYSESGVHIELHYELVEEGVANSARLILENVWSYAQLKEGASAQHEMSAEMLYFYHVAHMAKHFQHGGCGIKPFIDTYVLDANISCDAEKLSELLESGGLRVFDTRARELCDVWMRGEEHTPLTLEMESFVLSGGVYGTMSNRVSVEQTRRGGKLKYALSRIFLKYDSIKYAYPILQKHKWLLPVMEVRRWGRLIFCGGFKRSVTELKVNNDLSREKAAEMQSFFEDIGL